MVTIKITPSHGSQSGSLRATGHAGDDLICNTITAICECLAVNLNQCWDVRMLRRGKPGDYSLRWNPSTRHSKGIQRANQAAGFTFNGLTALAKQYPNALTVEWVRPDDSLPIKRREGQI